MGEKWVVTSHPIRILSHYAVRVRDYSVRYADRVPRVCVCVYCEMEESPVTDFISPQLYKRLTLYFVLLSHCFIRHSTGGSHCQPARSK